MQAQQNQNTIGFSLLELLVLLAIVSVISGIGFPKFSKWSKDREVRKSAEQVSTMLSTITASVQRGNYSFVQLIELLMFFLQSNKNKLELKFPHH